MNGPMPGAAQRSRQVPGGVQSQSLLVSMVHAEGGGARDTCICFHSAHVWRYLHGSTPFNNPTHCEMPQPQSQQASTTTPSSTPSHHFVLHTLSCLMHRAPPSTTAPAVSTGCRVSAEHRQPSSGDEGPRSAREFSLKCMATDQGTPTLPSNLPLHMYTRNSFTCIIPQCECLASYCPTSPRPGPRLQARCGFSCGYAFKLYSKRYQGTPPHLVGCRAFIWSNSPLIHVPCMCLISQSASPCLTCPEIAKQVGAVQYTTCRTSCVVQLMWYVTCRTSYVIQLMWYSTFNTAHVNQLMWCNKCSTAHEVQCMCCSTCIENALVQFMCYFV
jgi:hypothetical protein